MAKKSSKSPKNIKIIISEFRTPSHLLWWQLSWSLPRGLGWSIAWRRHPRHLRHLTKLSSQVEISRGRRLYQAFSREPRSRWDLYQAEWAAQMHSSKPPKTSYLLPPYDVYDVNTMHEVRDKWPYAMVASCWVEFLPELLTICPAMMLPKMKGIQYLSTVGIFKSKNIATCSMVYVRFVWFCPVLAAWERCEKHQQSSRSSPCSEAGRSHDV